MSDRVEPLGGGWYFVCPGCNSGHRFGPGWEFNGDRERPTFSPSLVSRIAADKVCHLFLRDGRIEFLQDSHHELAGKTVDLPPLKQSIRE